LCLAFGRHRIDFRRIEHVDAAVDRTLHLRAAFGFGVLLAEGHGAETELAHLHAGAAKLAIMHFLPILPRGFSPAHGSTRDEIASELVSEQTRLAVVIAAGNVHTARCLRHAN
jgi:hypothetical protein